MSSMCINKNHERNIPEEMKNLKRSWLTVPSCTVALCIAQVNRMLSQVYTSFAICMALPHTALEGCHRQEALFQAAQAVS